MDETQVAPPVDSQPTPVETPPAPAGASADPGQAASGADASLQRAYTQVSQKNAAIAAALGIPKTSSTEQFVAAINARRASLAAADSEIQTNPELARREAELRAREERLIRQQYGDSADLALAFRDAAVTGGSLMDLVALVDETLADRAASRGSAAAAAAAQPAAAPQPAPQQAPERGLMAEPPRARGGMVDPGVTPDREAGPEGFFKQLAQRVPALRG